MTLSGLVFWLTTLLTAGSALVVVGARNILHAGFALCLTFLGVAALYIFLNADFVAAVQLIVYVGGILVLIMFGIMFSSNAAEEVGEKRRSTVAMVAGLLVAATMFAAIVLLTRRLQVPLAQMNDVVADYQPS